MPPERPESRLGTLASPVRCRSHQRPGGRAYALPGAATGRQCATRRGPHDRGAKLMPTPRKSLEDRLREKLNSLPLEKGRWGRSLNAVSEATGVNYDSLKRFMSGDVGLSLKNAEKLMRFFGMRVVEKSNAKGG